VLDAAEVGPLEGVVFAGMGGSGIVGDVVAKYLEGLLEVPAVVVKSRYGMHILWLHQRAEPRELPFEAVRDTVARYLHDASWRRAVHQFIAVLAGRAQIEGVAMDGATTPLVQ
ncbi:MAG: hypothetical protein ACK4ST_06265, partial [Elioraea tepidiphila]